LGALGHHHGTLNAIMLPHVLRLNAPHISDKMTVMSTALRFQSQLALIKDDHTVNGKSIMAVMTVGAGCGSELTLRMQGPDEADMSQALVQLIENRFGETE
jgi:phosphocarrier protein